MSVRNRTPISPVAQPVACLPCHLAVAAHTERKVLNLVTCKDILKRRHAVECRMKEYAKTQMRNPEVCSSALVWSHLTVGEEGLPRVRSVSVHQEGGCRRCIEGAATLLGGRHQHGLRIRCSDTSG
jgi:hypothetical protein